MIVDTDVFQYWKGYSYAFGGVFDSGVWTIYIEDHPLGCGFYDNTTRLQFIF